MAQIAWLSLLGLWIYWYVINYVNINKFGAENIPDASNVFALVSGLILLVFISAAMSFIFIWLSKQISLNKMYDNFIANITHELKSPLSSIQLYLETMSSRKVPEKKRTDFINIMLKDVERLNNLINSILYMSGFERKKTARQYPHDYHIYVAEEVIRELIFKAADRYNIPSESILIKGKAPCNCVIDKNWLEITINNLVDNANKYSKDPLTLDIIMRCTRKNFIFYIRDNGIGIDFKNQKKIFNKFQRIYNSSNPNVKGTGLGLYWVKEIVKYHGGKIRVSSKGLGKGTVFRIDLPIYQATKKRYIRNLLEWSRIESEGNNE
jgi:signal transduction histidine kinase